MTKRLLSILALALLVIGTAPMARAELADLGIPIDPHGFPAYYEDTDGLQLELCLPAPAGHATRPELCVFDELDLGSPILVAGEVFWWMGTARIDLPTGGQAELTLGIEGTFGGPEAPVDGQQISFGRTRIRVDTPVAGTYTVTHPYGVHEFTVTEADLAAGINFTADIGAADFQDPANGFRGTLNAPIGPFLTWPDYATNPDLQVLELDGEGQPTGVVLEQYVGDPNLLSTVVGSPNGTNFFRVEGPAGFGTVEIDQFSIMGKVFDASQPQVAHIFPEAPFQILYAVGPVNRVVPFAEPTTGTVTGVDIPDYSVGYPVWYQENSGTIDLPAPGLKYTLCNPGTIDPENPDAIPNPMCISDPIDPEDPAHVALRTGGEGFWWSAGAIIDSGEDQFELVLGLEATFGGDESIIDGQQISFTRERIRIDTNENGAGTYRITHPYGERIFEGVPADDGGIDFTADIGIADPADPDGAFIGALYALGPQLLKWTTFNADPALTSPLLVKLDIIDPTRYNYFVGDPGMGSPVAGSPTDNNLFRVEKLIGGTVESEPVWEVLGETALFNVSGQMFYDPVTLTVVTAGSGSVASDLPPDPPLIDCGLDCTEIFPVGKIVNLTATAEPGWAFDGWSGACIGTEPTCQFVMHADSTVNATFSEAGAVLTVITAGDGVVASDPAGTIDCGLDCSENYPIGSSVTLTSTANTGSLFTGWSGACTGTDATCTFTLDIDTTVNAAFVSTDSRLGSFDSGTWYLDTNNKGTWDGAGFGLDSSAAFGTAGMIPVAGDWNGDGLTEVGAYDNGTWYLDLNGNGVWDEGDATHTFGTSAMKPVAGDWNNDGIDEIGAYEDGTWYLDANGSGSWDAGDVSHLFGTAAMTPVTGNWDGTGGDEIGAYENGVWYLDVNGSGSWDAGDVSPAFGTEAMIPVPGDWDNDGTDEIGAVDGGTWYLDVDGSGAWDGGDVSHVFGASGMTPISGVWR